MPAAVEITNLSYTYSKKTPYEKKALEGICFSVEKGEFFGIVGSTGSGKSTLISHLNGLLKKQQGSVKINGLEVEKKNLKAVRSMVGMVFQYPEYQLFEETVYKDVAFGPKNLRLQKDEIDLRVKEALNLVGLDFDKYAERSPFELSGGEKRRAAIAGVLAMRPEILVLDEVAAGLDPEGKKDILALVKRLQKTMCPTVIFISHNMDDVASLCDRVAVLNDGRLLTVGEPRAVFSDAKAIIEAGLELPTATLIQKKLENKGINFSKTAIKIEELAQMLLERRANSVS